MPKIAIDAGHGYNTAGKRCLKSIDKSETREWFLNDRIADKLESMLKAYKCETLRVDDTTGKKDIALAARCTASNNWGADLYISIHHNAGIKGGSGGGTVVYYYSSNDKRENEAQALYKAVVNATGLKGNRSEKVIKNAFYALKHTKAAAFLLENGFMDSATDVPIILTEAHAEKTAQALLKFIVDYFKLEKKDEQPASATDTLYKVQSGAFKNKANAEALKNKLKAAGFEAVVVRG